jgi:hypothetical protein
MTQGAASEPERDFEFAAALHSADVKRADSIPKAAPRNAKTARLVADPWRFAAQSVPAYLRSKLGLASIGEAKVLATLLQLPGKLLGHVELAQACNFKLGSAKVAASRLRSSLKRVGLEHHLHGGAVSGLSIDCDIDGLLSECDAPSDAKAAPEASKSALVELTEFSLRRELKLRRNAEGRLLAKLISRPKQPFTTAELAAATGCCERSVKQYVSHLRHSLERQGAVGWIETFRQSDCNAATQYALSASGHAELLLRVSPQLGEALGKMRRQSTTVSAGQSVSALGVVDQLLSFQPLLSIA